MARLSYLCRVSALNRTFSTDLGAATEARRAVMALPLSEEMRDKLALLVSELITNSVRHAGWSSAEAVNRDGLIHLLIERGNGRVRVAVRDDGPGFSPADVDKNDQGGLGLVVVRALSDEWGVESDTAGCTVWCTISTGD